MIDIENEVFTKLATKLRELYGGIFVTGEYINAPSAFPHVSIVEADNYSSRADSSDEEKYAVVSYEINIYSNKRVGKKNECKEIASTINSIMHGLNFKRLAMTPIPNLNNATIYRIVARYRAETDGENIYRRN